MVGSRLVVPTGESKLAYDIRASTNVAEERLLCRDSKASSNNSRTMCAITGAQAGANIARERPDEVMGGVFAKVSEDRNHGHQREQRRWGADTSAVTVD